MLLRRPKPPAEWLTMLTRDERVVSFADTADGVVLATNVGLWWPDPAGPRRIGWERIDKAVWRDGILTVTEADLVDDLLLVDRPPLGLALTVPRDLPPTVRKRVESTVAQSEVITLGSGAVRLVARRVPGQDGVAWWARLEHGTRDTPSLRAAVQARIDDLRRRAQPL